MCFVKTHACQRAGKKSQESGICHLSEGCAIGTSSLGYKAESLSKVNEKSFDLVPPNTEKEF